jgi:hypothetical protein
MSVQQGSVIVVAQITNQNNDANIAFAGGLMAVKDKLNNLLLS